MDGRLWIFHGVMIFALYTAAKAAGRVEGAQQEKNRQKRPGPKKGRAAHFAKADKEADETQPLFRAMENLTAYDGTNARQKEMEDVHEQWDQ
jgi:hypothetical protein|nr:MAG TPA: hypothetical protein [Caudoviricetes sp.]